MRTTEKCPYRTTLRLALPRTVVTALLACTLCVMLSGCGGCSKDDPAAQDKSKGAAREEPEDEFEIGALEVLPSDSSLIRNFVKPGHFVTATIPARANKVDFRAELETSTVDQNIRPIMIWGTRFFEVTSRPIVLAKGQNKYLESTYFVPRGTGGDSRAVFLRHQLRAARGGRVAKEQTQITRQLPAYQYLFVVLATNPNAYGHLKQLESISAPYDELIDVGVETIYYRVILPSVETRTPLPSHPFAWSSTAYVLWDGMRPELLTAPQQQAILDWLQWGGQLIISGPNSLASLKNSFLEPFLPATFVGTLGLDQAAFRELNEHWSLHSTRQGERMDLKVAETRPVIGVRYDLAEDAEYLEGTGELVVERRVGRGRVVVTAFSLADREIVNWRSYDSFFNACLLRRPRRVFGATRLGSVRVAWADLEASQTDPRVATATRYFSRDIGADMPGTATIETDGPDDWHMQGFQGAAESGIGGWNDYSGAADAARKTLREAAGISIPDVRFVLIMLAAYLIVLVPVNWGFFRMLGRVEWAWAVAPLIAVVGAVAVVRIARLDIGFVRSRTEIVVVEGQGGYPRSHVTRFTALYTSLSESYEVQFDDLSAVARPFFMNARAKRIVPVKFRAADDARLSGFLVDSNSTGFLHSEQMLDLGGAVQLQGRGARQPRLKNGTTLHLEHVGVLHKTVAGTLRTAWFDQLPPSSSTAVRWNADEGIENLLERWRETVGASDELLDVNELIGLATSRLQLRRGDVRLVGWCTTPLQGMSIQPTASQTKTRTMVLLHLRYGPLPPPRPDQNLVMDVRRERPADESNNETERLPSRTVDQE